MKTITMLVAIMFLTLLPAYGENITLLWEPSPSPNVIGYAVYYDQVVPEVGQKWANVNDVGNVLTTTMPKSGFAKGVWYFSVTAYSDTLESDFSNVVDFEREGFVIVDVSPDPPVKPSKVIVTIEVQ